MADANIIVKIIDQTSGGINNITRQVNDVERSVKRTNTAFSGVNRALGAFVGFLGARELLRFANDIQTINNRIRLVTDGTQELNSTFDRLLTVANNTRSDLGAVATLYSQLTLATQDLGLSQDTVIGFTETFNQLLAIAGAETAAAEGATRQLAQALASGAFRGDEFNSVVEAAPGILDALARELGVTRGEVRALAGDGQITAEVLVRALTASAEAIDDQFNQTTVTIGQALTVLQNNFLALGRESSPVLDAIAELILFIAENLEVAVGVVAAFGAAFVFTQAVSALQGLRAAVLAVNVAIAANPIGLIATAISTAIVGIYVYWDDLKNIAVGTWEAITNSYREFEAFIVRGFNNIKIAGLSIWTGIQTTYLEFENALLSGVENLINTVVSGFTSFANEITAQFRAVAAAAQDPLNAFEAYETALVEARAELEQNRTGVVDFSGAVAENEQRINSLNAELQNEINALEESANQVDANTGAMGTYDDAILRVERQTNDTTTATEDFTDSTEDLNAATEESVTVQERREQALRDAEAALAAANKAVDESIDAIETETAAIGMSQKERRILAQIIENENTIREALGDTVEKLSQDEIRAIQRAITANETATLDFLRLSDDRVQAIIDVIDQNEQATLEYEEQQERQAEAARQRAIEEERAQQRVEDFIADSLREVEQLNYEAMDEIQQLVQDKEDYIREVEELGLQDRQEIMDRLAAYDRQITDARIAEAERLAEEQTRLARQAAQEAERAARVAEQNRREAARETQRFIDENERMVRSHYRSTLTEVQRLEMDRVELIEEANARGLANHQSTQNAILAIDQQIAAARIEAEEEVTRERAKLMDEQVDKYSTIYGEMESKLLDFVGINRREFQLINEAAELFFGIEGGVAGILRGTFAEGTLAIENFRNGGENTLGGFGGFVGNLFGRGGSIFEAITGAFDGSIFENFVNIGKNLLGGLGSSIGNIFGGISDTIGNIFGGGGGGGIGGAIGGIVDTVSNIFGGGGSSTPSYTGGSSRAAIAAQSNAAAAQRNAAAYGVPARGSTSTIGNIVNTVGNLFGGGGGNIISNAVSAVSDFFGGFFDNGGMIPAGQAGIVGEYGPELVSGPAMVTSRRDTASMMGDVNVNFTINAVDAKDLDRLLVEKQDVIKNIVQSAVNQRGRRI